MIVTTSLLALLVLAADEAGKADVPLVDGLGSHSRKIAAKDATAQRYFDQGLMYMFAYNHDEAMRAFGQASRLDDQCAMAYWGVALASGMNYNDPSFTPEKAKRAAEALAKARQTASTESPVNQALINALAARYPDPAPKERADAEKAYSAAMKKAFEQFPSDADVGALYAESIMNLRPWDLWKEGGQPQPETPEILRAIEAALQIDAMHPLANHLYIHALEASPDPGKADAASNALRGKYPALGHLLHMPSHIDIRRGRWQEALDANQKAIVTDAAYQKSAPELGFYRMYIAHNFHMLTFAAVMQGRSELALTTIRAMLAGVPQEWLAVKEHQAIADGFSAMPLEVLKRFGRWDDILAAPEPPPIFPIARAMWRYQRGVSFAAKGDVTKAREEEKLFRDAVKAVPEGATFSNNKAADLLVIAGHMLDGEILFREKKVKEAVAALEKAVAQEDKLRYAEPPDWFVPARHALGAILLHDGQAAAAEKVYREDLRRWPENGWSLHGLARSLVTQGKTEEAGRVEEQFKNAWKQADVKILSSCFCVGD